MYTLPMKEGGKKSKLDIYIYTSPIIQKSLYNLNINDYMHVE